jgi:hypothetical protein
MGNAGLLLRQIAADVVGVGMGKNDGANLLRLPPSARRRGSSRPGSGPAPSASDSRIDEHTLAPGLDEHAGIRKVDLFQIFAALAPAGW